MVVGIYNDTFSAICKCKLWYRSIRSGNILFHLWGRSPLRRVTRFSTISNCSALRVGQFLFKGKVKGENWKVRCLRRFLSEKWKVKTEKYGIIFICHCEELHQYIYLIPYLVYAILWQRRHWDESRGRLRTMPRRGGEKPTLVGLIYHCVNHLNDTD